jgi:N-acetylneuraminic acid mutarotase
LGTKLYVFGGYDLDLGSEVNSMIVYDIYSNTWELTATSLPSNFFHLGSSITVADTLYFFGGLSDSDTYNSYYRGVISPNPSINGTVASYNMEYNTWNYALPNMPTPRFQSTSFAIDNRIYVAGGRDNQFDSSVIDILDISSNAWLAPSELPGLALSQAATVVSSRLGMKIHY